MESDYLSMLRYYDEQESNWEKSMWPVVCANTAETGTRLSQPGGLAESFVHKFKRAQLDLRLPRRP